MSFNTLKKIKHLSRFAKITKIKQIKISESSARDWRFQCFARLYLNKKYSILLTGHTATDRAETAFLKLLRGTSLQGIRRFGSTKTYKSVYPKFYNYSIFFSNN